MAERRMFARSVVESDAFLDMPISARLLYYDLGMRGDDDGFVDSPRRIMRVTGASEDDLRLLIAKQFLIPFNSGVVVIRHWATHNYIRPDRYKPTQYKLEKSALSKDKSGVYISCIPSGIPNDNQVSTTCLPNGYITEQNRTEVNRKEDILPGAESAPDRNPTNQTNGAVTELPAAESAMTELPVGECAVIELPLNDGSMFAVLQSNVDRWAELYPAVDIMQQLRAMVGWCEANSSRRKTKRGIHKFINGWLAREQDKGGSTKGNAQTAERKWDYL